MSTQKRAANGHDDDDRDDDADAFVAGVAADATFSDYKFVKQIGKGGYGVVYMVKKVSTGQTFALKRLISVFAMPVIGRRVLREIKVLRHLRGHENIVFLHEVLRPNVPMYQEVYIVQEYMPSDLNKIIYSKQELTEEHFQYFLYQILRGLKFIHSSNIMHRDLKPSNLLINESCDLKICDFGLARGVGENEFATATPFMTEYVATRWYRAPEILIALNSYTKAVDVWSVGCIFGEMLWRKPVFRGNDYVHQLKLILAMRGTPPPEYFNRIVSEPTRQFLQSLPFVRKAPLRSVFPRASDLALDLLDKMLTWSPEERLTAEAALAHPYFARYHNPAEEPTCPPFDPRFENDAINEVALRALVTKEVDFDHIRWMQLAEHRRVLEEQDEVHKQQQATIELARKQLEQARLQELAAAQKKQSEEEALFRKQQELEFAQRQIMLQQQYQQQLLFQQHQQQHHLQQPQQQQQQQQSYTETTFTLEDGMDYSFGESVLGSDSAPPSAPWRNIVSPNARLDLVQPVNDQFAWIGSPKSDNVLSQMLTFDGGAVPSEFFAVPTDMDGFYESLESELSGYNREN